MADLERLTSAQYVQNRGFPSAKMAQAAYDDVDLNRAIQAYRFFTHLRLYGPEAPAFNGDWTAGD